MWSRGFHARDRGLKQSQTTGSPNSQHDSNRRNKRIHIIYPSHPFPGPLFGQVNHNNKRFDFACSPCITRYGRRIILQVSAESPARRRFLQKPLLLKHYHYHRVFPAVHPVSRPPSTHRLDQKSGRKGNNCDYEDDGERRIASQMMRRLGMQDRP